ncbi:hypothetical protein FHL15_001167 [Xylaria flabelliformis]|uniref:Uncharacterized protein n=1 Tax=Xylaria flabelliformis TaxID=2512241 RepID=A0A553ICM9_9PEZI|nr:hypothetical protein FHL15_001167 [Xylaria flabelliformis]
MAYLYKSPLPGIDSYYRWLPKPPNIPPIGYSRPPRQSNRAGGWTIYGEVMGRSVAALPDSGADVCFISPELAISLGLHPQPGTQRLVKLANGRKLISPGAVGVPWKFANEEKKFDITCWILPGCTYTMILGSKFLEKTKCLTTLRHRIRRKHISPSRYIRVNLLGEGKQRLWGHLNDDLVAALPDTGSDAMIVSWDYAWRHGLRVDSNPNDIAEVEFADGTTVLTDGIVRDAIWSSSGHSIRCDFLVLNDLPVDVILDKNYLFDMDVFSSCTANLMEDDDIEHLDACGVRLVREFGERFGGALDQLEGDSIEDVISEDAFSPAMIDREWGRRDRIRDEIEALKQNERAEAEAAEARRQEQWERARAEHRLRWAQAQPPRGLTAGSTPQRSPQVALAQSQLAPPKITSRRSRWLKRARVSVPLLPLRGKDNSHTSRDLG